MFIYLTNYLNSLIYRYKQKERNKMSKELDFGGCMFAALAGVNHRIENNTLFEKKYKKYQTNLLVEFVDKVIREQQNKLFDDGMKKILEKENNNITEMKKLHRAIYGY